MSGIHGCWLIYQEYAEPPRSSGEQVDAEEDEEEEDDEEPDDAYYETQHEELMAAFIEAVRAEADERHERLL